MAASRAAENQAGTPNQVRRKQAHQRLDELMDDAEREALTGEVFVRPRFRNGKVFLIERGSNYGDHFQD